MSTRKPRWITVTSIFVMAFAIALILGGCGGGGGSSSAPEGDAAIVSDDGEAVSQSENVKLVMDEPEAPVLQDGAPIESQKAPNCQPASGASAFNTINSYYVPGNAFDGDMNTWWAGVQGAGEWDLYYQIPSNFDVPLDSVSVLFYSEAYVPSEVRLYVSTGGCTWVDVGLLTGGAKPSIQFNAPVRYLWISMKGNPASNFPLVRDVDWTFPHKNYLASGGPSANEARYFPSNAFDGDLNTWWAGKPGAGAWDIYYVFKSPRDIQAITVALFNSNYRPQSMKLHVSYDGLSWTEIGEMGPGENPTEFVGRSIQYFRLEMVGNPPSQFPLIKDVISYDLPDGPYSGDSIKTYYKPENAFDGNPSTWWVGAQNQTEWNLIYKFTTQKYIDSFVASYYADSHAPGTVTAYISDDGINWTARGSSAGSSSTTVAVGAPCVFLRISMSSVPPIGYPLIKDVTINENSQSGSWLRVGQDSVHGSIHPTAEGSNYMRIAVNSSDEVYVVWPHEISMINSVVQYSIYVRMWDGLQWKELNGSASGAGISQPGVHCTSPTIAMDASGKPIVTWEAYNYGVGGGIRDVDIYASRWNGATWESMGIIATNVKDPYMPEMKLDSNGIPYYVWADGIQVKVKRWNGASWEALGDSGSPGIAGTSVYGLGETFNSSIAFDENDNPIVAWGTHICSSETYNIYMEKWTGAAWVAFSPGSNAGFGLTNFSSTAAGVATSPKLTYDENGYLTLFATSKYDLVARTWNGSSWVLKGTAINKNGVRKPSYGEYDVGHTVDGRLFVAWAEDADYAYLLQYGTYIGNIFASVWNGSGWDALGAQSVDKGISNNDYENKSPSIAVGSNGAIYLGWKIFDKNNFLLRHYVYKLNP